MKNTQNSFLNAQAQTNNRISNLPTYADNWNRKRRYTFK